MKNLIQQLAMAVVFMGTCLAAAFVVFGVIPYTVAWLGGAR